MLSVNADMDFAKKKKKPPAVCITALTGTIFYPYDHMPTVHSPGSATKDDMRAFERSSQHYDRHPMYPKLITNLAFFLLHYGVVRVRAEPFALYCTFLWSMLVHEAKFPMTGFPESMRAVMVKFRDKQRHKFALYRHFSKRPDQRRVSSLQIISRAAVCATNFPL